MRRCRPCAPCAACRLPASTPGRAWGDAGPRLARGDRVESLFARASSVDVVECRLPSGRVAHLRRLQLPLGRASPDRLPEGSLAPTYTSKPLVTFNGAAMFGELALLKWLEL